MLSYLFISTLVVGALAKGPKVTNRVFFDVTIGGEDAGRITMDLYVRFYFSKMNLL